MLELADVFLKPLLTSKFHSSFPLSDSPTAYFSPSLFLPITISISIQFIYLVKKPGHLSLQFPQFEFCCLHPFGTPLGVPPSSIFHANW